MIGYEKIKFLNSIFPSRILFLESSSSPFKFSFSDSLSSRKKNVLCAAKEVFSQVTVIKDERCVSNWGRKVTEIVVITEKSLKAKESKRNERNVRTGHDRKE